MGLYTHEEPVGKINKLKTQNVQHDFIHDFVFVLINYIFFLIVSGVIFVIVRICRHIATAVNDNIAQLFVIAQHCRTSNGYFQLEIPSSLFMSNFYQHLITNVR